jgi:hypothetical protein
MGLCEMRVFEARAGKQAQVAYFFGNPHASICVLAFGLGFTCRGGDDDAF